MLKLLQFPMRAFSSSPNLIRFTIHDSSDNVYKCEGAEGETLMQAGLRARVQFEVACGGNAECCTCHVKLQDSVMKSPYYIAAESKEIDALDWAVGTDDTSRLACQVKLTEAFDSANVRFIGD